LFDDVSVDANLYDDLNNSIVENKNIIISDPYICLKKVQDKLVKKLSSYFVEWIYFDNDPAQCMLNAASRNKKVDGLIKLLSEKYYIPDGVPTIKVYRR